MHYELFAFSFSSYINLNFGLLLLIPIVFHILLQILAIYSISLLYSIYCFYIFKVSWNLRRSALSLIYQKSPVIFTGSFSAHLNVLSALLLISWNHIYLIHIITYELSLFNTLLSYSSNLSISGFTNNLNFVVISPFQYGKNRTQN